MPPTQLHLSIDWVGRGDKKAVGRTAAVGARLSDARTGQPLGGARIEWLAAAPPERRSSYTGSCLPFASEQMALEGTPNRGVATLDADGRFVVQQLLLPNSYYVGLGTVLVPPSLHVRVLQPTATATATATARLPPTAAVPYRTLTYPASRTGPSFYQDADAQKVVRSQQDLLFRRGYPAPAAYF